MNFRVCRTRFHSGDILEFDTFDFLVANLHWALVIIFLDVALHPEYEDEDC